MIYFLKLNLVIALLFLAYHFLLRKEKFFRLNRIVLLSIIGLAFLLPLLPAIEGSSQNGLQRQLSDFSPFLDWRTSTETVDALGAATNNAHLAAPQPPPIHTTASSFTPTNILQGTYALVALALILRLLGQLYHVRRLIKGSRRETNGGLVYWNHDLELPPFSFFRYLMLNKDQYDPAEAVQIIAHEQVHIRQGHTFDLLLLEFLHALLWINPFMPAFKRAVRLNLEYMADEEVLATGVDPRAYQYSILACLQHPGLPLVNLFNSSKIKLRIHMMNKKRPPMRNLYKYALVLPLLAGTYLIVNPLKARSMPLQITTTNQPARQDLKALEGYYQSDFNKEVYIQIHVAGDQLFLKQLWDDKDIPFKQLSELEFSAMDGKFPLKFSKDAQGAIVQVLAFNRDHWNKVKTYTPVTYITLKPAQLRPFEGFYQMRDKEGQMIYIQILSTDDGLVLRQGWDGEEIPFKPMSVSTFFNKKETFPLEFTRDKNGNVVEVTAFHRDHWKKMQDGSGAVIKKEIKLEPAQLKALEGEYHMQSNNGENASIRIQATEKGIVLKELWGGNVETQLLPSSPTEFFCKDRSFPLVFTLDKNGVATELLAFGRDRWEKIK